MSDYARTDGHRISIVTMRHALVAASVILAATFCPVAVSQFTIGRNTDDCIAPSVTDYRNACDKVNAFPKSTYWASGTAIQRLSDGGTKITNKAGFSVTYYRNYKVVENTVAKETYVLFHCGCNAPSSIPSGAKTFRIPLQSISADDTSVGEFMNQCSVIDRVAYASEYGVNGCYQLLTQCGYGAPDPGYNTNGAAGIANQVDAFITYAAVPSNPKAIAMSAVAAKHPLTRSEWLKYFAAFFNKEFESEALFRVIRNNYNDLKRGVASKAQPKRIVAWTYVRWDAKYVISKAPFKVAYVTEAGGQMVADSTIQAIEGFTKEGNDWVLPQAYTAQWADLLKKVDVIIDETYNFATGTHVRLDELLKAHKLEVQASSIPAVARREVYTIAGTASQTISEGDNVGTVGLDWYERGTARCDEVLRDFVKVLLPATAQPPVVQNWNRKWLLRLNGETQKQIAKQCPVKSAQLDMSTCTRVQKFVYPICPNTVRDCNTGNFQYPPQNDRCAAVAEQKKVMRERRRKKLPSCVVPA